MLPLYSTVCASCQFVACQVCVNRLECILIQEKKVILILKLISTAEQNSITYINKTLTWLKQREKISLQINNK